MFLLLSVLIFVCLSTKSEFYFSSEVRGWRNLYMKETEDGFIVMGEAAGTLNAVYGKYNLRGDLKWMKTFGTNNEEKFSIHYVEPGFLVVGQTYAWGSGDSGFISRLDHEGEISWLRSFSSGNEYIETSILHSDGYLYVTGYQENTPDQLFVAKFSTSDGSQEWAIKCDSGTNTYGLDITEYNTDGVSGVAVAGTYTNGLDDLYVAVFSGTDGSLEWKKTYDFGSSVSYATITQNQDDENLYVTCNTGTETVNTMKFTPDGTLIWGKTFGIDGYNSAIYSSSYSKDGGVLLGGFAEFIGSGGPSSRKYASQTKYSNEGEIEWITALEKEDEGEIYSISESSDGSVIVSGKYDYEGIENAIVSKLDIETGLACGVLTDIIDLKYIDIENGTASIDSTTYSDIDFTINLETVSASIFNPISVDLVCTSCKDDNYFGDNCNITTCNNIMSNSTDIVCNDGNGECVDYNECKCDDFYHGQYCTVFECAGFLSNETMCNGEGTCVTVGGEECDCNDYYFGDGCEIYECAGFLSNETMCNGRGYCVSAGGLSCNCNVGWNGDFCENEVVDPSSDGAFVVSVLSMMLFFLFVL